jgi:hypothetical protein
MHSATATCASSCATTTTTTTSSSSSSESPVAAPRCGEWYAWLDSPGGPLPFGLELTQHAEHGGWQGIILNPPERIAIDVEVDSATCTLTLNFPYYDARVTASLSADGGTLHGKWASTGRASPPVGNAVDTLPFHAEHGQRARFPPAGSPSAVVPLDPPLRSSSLPERWAVEFSSAVGATAVLMLEHRAQSEDGYEEVTGTFLTDTGLCCAKNWRCAFAKIC